MAAGYSHFRNGMLAGGLAMMVSLLAMQMISRVIGPELLLTTVMVWQVIEQLWSADGWIAKFLLDGDPQVRVLVTLVILFVAIGAALGRWAATRGGNTGTYVLQAGATLFFILFTALYVTRSWMVEYFMQETIITLALSTFVWIYVANWLLAAPGNRNRWRIAWALALVAIGVIIYDISNGI